VIPWSPVARGALAKPRSATSLRTETDIYLSMLVTNQQRDSEKEIIDRVEALAKKKGISMAQVATAWLLSKDSTSLVFDQANHFSCYCAYCWS
jgi:versiconal hemiacetal acetate reductase